MGSALEACRGQQACMLNTDSWTDLARGGHHVGVHCLNNRCLLGGRQDRKVVDVAARELGLHRVIYHAREILPLARPRSTLVARVQPGVGVGRRHLKLCWLYVPPLGRFHQIPRTRSTRARGGAERGRSGARVIRHGNELKANDFSKDTRGRGQTISL